MTNFVDVKTAKTGFWHMPKTFYAVLFIEFWERYAYYGLISVAVIYFVKKFGMLEAHADILFGSFSSLLFAMLVVGGVIGDKILGLRRTYLLGIIFLIAGYSLLFISSSLTHLYMAMGLVLVGNILFKTNANNFVGRCFELNDPRLDSAYTYFYMSINIGSFSGIVSVPIVSQIFGYEIGLSLMAIGMVVALISYFVFISRFKHSDNLVGKNGTWMWLKMLLISIAAIVLAYLFSILLKNAFLSKIILYAFAVITLVVYCYIASRLNHYEAKGMYIALLLILQAVVFYVLYIQSATSMTLFALHNVRLTFLGYTVPAGVTQSFNSISVVLLSPILANLYMWRRKVKGQDFSIPFKFAAGVIICGLCFISLGIGAQFFADSQSDISVLWLLLAYVLYSLGELLVSAIGPSMVSQLLPQRLGGFAQGVWFLGSAIGYQIGGQLSAFAAIDSVGKNTAHDSLNAYMELFYRLGGVTVLIGIGFLLLVKPIYKSIEEIKQHYG